ncbi:hypothetical protein BH20ACT19_BH20ACT19_12750 [soil metagenome]
MRTTIELSGPTYKRLRAEAGERGMRGFSPIVEEAVERLLGQPAGEGPMPPALAEAEGAWSQTDVEDWERARKEAWSAWRTDPPLTPTS